MTKSATTKGPRRAGGWGNWLVLGCFWAAGPAPAGEELPASHSVTPELCATGFAFAEGPTFDVQGNLYAVNYRELGTIGRITPDGSASIWCDLTKASPVQGRQVQANGLKVDSEGRLIAADAGGGRVAVTFADTMVMSTYLVAFVVGPLEVTEAVDAGGTPLRVVHPPGKAHLTAFALEVGAFALAF